MPVHLTFNNIRNSEAVSEHVNNAFEELIKITDDKFPFHVTLNKIIKVLKDFYKHEPFIKINKPNSQMGTGNVLNTNLCELSICQSKIKDRVVIFSAIDNLIKGAAGQAVQNMNIMFNLSQTRGLK